jgi:hypothetical protein
VDPHSLCEDVAQGIALAEVITDSPAVTQKVPARHAVS